MTDAETRQLLIYNLALRHIGMNKITSLTGTDPSTVILNEFWIPCRDIMFEEHQWSFANAQVELTEFAGDAALYQGYAFAYDYPTENAAAIWAVFNEATTKDKDTQDFDTFRDVENDKLIIATNLDEAIAEVTHIVEDPTMWPWKFCLALSYNLAASICTSLTGDVDKSLKLMNVYGALASDAKRIDASKQRKKPIQQSAYQNAR